MSIKPMGDRFIIKALEPEEKTKGGILIPDNAKEKPQQGEVVECGLSVKTQLLKGSTVFYGRYSGVEIETKEGEKLLVIKEEDILAYIIQ